MEIRLSEISGSSGEAVITEWHVAENQAVRKNDDLFEVSTDKATFEVFSPCDGIITGIFRKEGETVGRDDVVAVIREGA